MLWQSWNYYQLPELVLLSDILMIFAKVTSFVGKAFPGHFPCLLAIPLGNLTDSPERIRLLSPDAPTSCIHSLSRYKTTL